MGKLIDLTGKHFDRLLVLERADSSEGKRVMYLCECDCGNKIVTRAESLRSGHTQSCGCKHKDIVSALSTKHGHANTRLYIIWGSMIQRCCNPKHKAYKNYGGRGIKPCKKWLENFETFYQWAISNGYSDNLQLDRMDNNIGYQPSNCRFITAKENNRNRRCTKMVTYHGEVKPLAEFCDIMNINYDLVLNRINSYGWSVDRALQC